MLRALTASMFCFFMASSAVAAEVTELDRQTMRALFGESADKDLKLDFFAKETSAPRQLYMISTVAEDTDFSSGQKDIVADTGRFGFCESYFKVMNQVIMDDRAAGVQLVHTEGEPRITSYSVLKHVKRFFKKEQIVTQEERDATTVVASKTIQVNKLKVQSYGFDKHALLLEKCRAKRPRYTDRTTDKYFDQEYVYLIAKLQKLKGGSSSGSGSKAPATATSGTAR